MFRKVSNCDLYSERHYKTVTSKEVKFPLYRGIDQQRGRRFGAFAHVVWRMGIPFLPKFVVPPANRVGAELLKFDVREIADVVKGRKKFKTAEKAAGRQTLRKQLGCGGRKRTASRVIPTNAAEEKGCCEGISLHIILTNHVK